MNVAIYLRKSRADIEAEKQGEMETLARHRKTLLELAQKNGYNVIAIREEIVSGEKIADRPEMQRLLAEVRDGMYDAVLCMDMDRLGRGDMRDQGEILSAFKDTGTLIITPTKTYDLENEQDETWSEFEAFMARQEYKMIKRRLLRGKKRSAKDGAFLGTWPPLGYDKDKTNHLVPNEYAETVRKIFRWYAVDKLSLREIAARLDALCVPRRGTEWYPAVVQRILKNRVYLGEIHYGRKEKIIVKNAHPAIVDEELFNLAQGVLAGIKQKSPVRDNFQIRNPLAGLLYCAHCGRAMVARESHGFFRYECRIRTCRKVRSTRLDVVEKLVIDALKSIRNEFIASLEGFKQEVAPAIDPKEEYESIEKQVTMLKKQLSKVEDFLEQGVYTVEKYRERSKILTDRIQELQKQMKKIQLEYEEAQKRQEATQRLVPAIDSLLEVYEFSNVKERNMMLKDIIEKIIYDRPRLEKKWMRDDEPPHLDIRLRI